MSAYLYLKSINIYH